MKKTSKSKSTLDRILHNDSLHRGMSSKVKTSLPSSRIPRKPVKTGNKFVDSANAPEQAIKELFGK